MCAIAKRPLLRFDHHAGGPQSLMICGFFANQTEGVRHETEFRADRANTEPNRGQVIPDDHPMVPKLNELFGDHTFFLNSDGLNVVEPNETAAGGDNGKPCKLDRHGFDQSGASRTRADRNHRHA
jgi:hypothetical protein